MPTEIAPPEQVSQPFADQAEMSRSRAQTVTVLSSLFMSLFLAALDFTIVSPALPTIAHHFHSAAGYTWVGSAYLLANAATTPLWAKSSDIWGRKAMLLAAVALFFFGSLLCAAATSIAMLIAGRAVQGSAAGAIVILVNICVSDLFDIRTRGLYLGLTSLVWVFASGIGPVLGGLFTDKVSWRWCWWINLPFSGLAFFVLLFVMKGQPSETSLADGLKAVDWLGSISIIGVTVMFLLGLQLGGVTLPWDSPQVICLIVFGLALVVVFLFSEAKVAQYPVMPLALFSSRSNVASLLVCFLHGFTYISALYFLPLYFQAVGGQSALHSGLLILPIALAQSSTGILSGIFMKSTGRYLEAIWLGMTILTLGFGLFIRLSASYALGEVIAYQLVAGFGVGLVFQSPLIALQTRVAAADVATATATFGFARNVATAMSVAVGGVVFQNSMQAQRARLKAALGGHSDALNRLAGDAAGANVDIIAGLDPAARLVVRDVFAQSLRNVWIFYTCTAAAGLGVSLLIRRVKLVKVLERSGQSGDGDGCTSVA